MNGCLGMLNIEFAIASLDAQSIHSICDISLVDPVSIQVDSMPGAIIADEIFIFPHNELASRDFHHQHAIHWGGLAIEYLQGRFYGWIFRRGRAHFRLCCWGWRLEGTSSQI